MFTFTDLKGALYARHSMLVLTLLASFLTFAFGAPREICAQKADVDPPPDKAIQQLQWLGEKEEPMKAVLILRHAVEHYKKNFSARYYLGVALIRSGDMAGAQKSFETALRLNPTSLQARIGLARTLLLANQLEEAEKQGRKVLAGDFSRANPHYVFGVIDLLSGDSTRALAEVEASLNADSSFAPTFLLKSQALLLDALSEGGRAGAQEKRQRFFADALQSLEKYFSMVPDAIGNSLLVEQLKAIRFHAEADASSPGPEHRVFSGAEVTTRARVLSKPEPRYTEAARTASILGTVVLVAIVTPDGTVTNIVVLKALPFGLTEQCLEAAKRIQFTPAVKDGKLVSTFIQLEYNFNLY